MTNIRIKEVREVNGVKVVVERLKNSSNGAPRFGCDVIFENIACSVIIQTYEGNESAAEQAYEAARKFLLATD